MVEGRVQKEHGTDPIAQHLPDPAHDEHLHQALQLQQTLRYRTILLETAICCEYSVDLSLHKRKPKRIAPRVVNLPDIPPAVSL